MAKSGKVKWHDNGNVTISFQGLLPHEIRKGHTPRKSGSGIHADKRFKRKRGNQAKRAWLDE
jgi:hypothetical protein